MLKEWVIRNPVIGPLGRAAKGLVLRMKGRGDGAVVEQLLGLPHPHARETGQAVRALGLPLPDKDREWVDRIEAERTRLFGIDEELVDGSEGEGGLYDEGVTIGQACHVSKRPKPALSLYLMVRALKPKNIIELGTNLGVSSSYLAAALKENGEGGTLTTLDASRYRQKVAREVHGNLGIDNVSYVPGLFTDTLAETVERVGPVDMAFIDGHHQYQPTLDYFNAILPHSTPDATFIFDDIRYSDGMMRAWKELQADERLGLTVDLTVVGVGVRAAEGDPPRVVLPRIYAALV